MEFGIKFPKSRIALTCAAFGYTSTKFATRSYPFDIMPFVSDDPSWWPLINELYGFSYFVVVASAIVIYDWALTFGQEFELIWRQRWSRVTILYLGVRYIGILYAAINILPSLPSLSVTDVGCKILNSTLNWMTVVVNTMLGVIMIIRLYAMYQRSRKMLIFLVVIFVVFTIACGVITAIGDIHMLGEELILSGTHQCTYEWEGDIPLDSMAWALYIAWEVLALCLAVWIAVKHFCELQQSSTRWIIRDCFMVLMKTHVFYFVSFAAVSGFQLSYYSPNLKTRALETGTLIYTDHLEIFSIMQMFVLGPRLILSIREYHAKLVGNSDAGTGMSTIAFQERLDVSTGGDV